MPAEQDRENNLQHARLTAYKCMLKYGVIHTDYELIAEKSRGRIYCGRLKLYTLAACKAVL